MAEIVPRKGSLSFFNPFKSRSSSVSSSKNAPPSDLSIDELKLDQKSAIFTTRLRKTASPANSARSSKPGSKKSSLDQSRSLRQASFPAINVAGEWERDAETGERKDHTEMLHSLAHRESEESLAEKAPVLFAGIPPQAATEFLARLPEAIWKRIVEILGPADKASLALSCKPFRDLLGTGVWTSLDAEENRDAKAAFLGHLDQQLPDHLLCFPCRIYHVRTQKGQETLRPTNISNPIFNCPNAFNAENKVSRHRITVGRSLPFPFVQLILRAHKYSKEHGIHIDSMSRRYKDRDGEWSHQTRYAIVNGHLLVRVISSAFATPNLPPAGLRRLLYSPGDNFHPYFSVCAHWRDGNLMPAVKCALSHIPKPPDGSGIAGAAAKVQYHMHRPSPLITLCSECRPMRRCPECPTEYLIELRMQEDKSDPVKLFKHAIVITRWSDLGDGSSPQSLEWVACNGEAEFDSLAALGKRAISGVFESQFTVDQIPGQKIVSMNPTKEKRGEAGHSWY
ncbi:uncharacterized protein A1O5_07827 [Cladophialophora psammophila CBS 110553]|uniref:F-box domain-containing protein n=1 Tax=Cladophialophora psammophila CBS 110553 TaxID=1182543 RepID=W9WV41_9EURO|nr:uncharacterized protein A1O5_07827 [Cladophialophora psammophila CBS 110553]EXJ68895.1 hypothetical protein A1O5_07827 [Cladophialophora psammophila CBS 110553]